MSATRIFARSAPELWPQPTASATAATVTAPRIADPRRQVIVYQMQVQADKPVAMVLPIPVLAGSPDDAVSFIDLHAATGFFIGLDALFPRPASTGDGTRGMPTPASAPKPQLVVHKVGAFIALFVPSPADFARLDAGFRLRPELIAKVDVWRDWGFVVFQFQAGAIAPHPMAFTFPRRDPQGLYMPTMHIHDGTIPAQARFDHELYVQRTAADGWPAFTTGMTPGRGDV